MHEIIVASLNPVKVKAAELAFNECVPDFYYHFVPMEVNSGVASQPIGQHETINGMKNRLRQACHLYQNADYCISFEGGLCQNEDGSYYNRAWVGVCDRKRNFAYSSSTSFRIPQEIETLLKAGKDLGFATDQMFGEENSGQGLGAIGLLTDSRVDRVQYLVQPAIIAISELLHHERYFSEKI